LIFLLLNWDYSLNFHNKTYWNYFHFFLLPILLIYKFIKHILKIPLNLYTILILKLDLLVMLHVPLLIIIFTIIFYQIVDPSKDNSFINIKYFHHYFQSTFIFFNFWLYISLQYYIKIKFTRIINFKLYLIYNNI